MNDQSIHAHALELHKALKAYIEATYHISDSDLLRQRNELLNEPGIIHQVPFLESTPRYKTDESFGRLPGLSPAALEALQTLVPKNHLGKQVLFDPPYVHQAEALRSTVVEGRNLVIMTGTGSGKTESFLMPILAKLAIEAKSDPHSWGTNAVRAMVLYPMNALVNDQLSRLRAIFGDPRIRDLFKGWAGRPPRFTRYTSRTPYAGLRTKKKDQKNLKQIGDFYVQTWREAQEGNESSQTLLHNLLNRGKWPAKPDLEGWYGKPHDRWTNSAGQYKRAVTLLDDSELLTRHESHQNPADILVTNYSMLEYMLMRPVERDIFNKTSAWLNESKSHRFLLVVDEAHLYRGASGTEVAMLIRRLRDRLGVTNEQFQVIGSTASFSAPDVAKKFAAELTGTAIEDMDAVEGKYAFRVPDAPGTRPDADLLASIDLTAFVEGDPSARRQAVAPFLHSRGVSGDEELHVLLHKALEHYEPLNHLVNETMRSALATESLPEKVFPTVPLPTAERAVTVLTALASAAKTDLDSASLLPARVHTFFRGLQGLWVCMDPKCSGLPTPGSGVAGRLYAQPRNRCDSCNAIVLQLYTCRYCGTAYGVGYSPTPDAPETIWQEPGTRLMLETEFVEPLRQVDLLLTSLAASGTRDPAHHATFDLLTGEIDPAKPTGRVRDVFLAPPPAARPNRGDDQPAPALLPGRFVECACCGQRSRRSISPVQDHETKGDEPLRLLVSRQLQLQPPSHDKATPLAPLRGRKVLIFSDSRQVAARLAPQLQTYSTRDAVRAAVAIGWQHLASSMPETCHLGHLYTAALLGAHMLGIRLRPELRAHESFQIYDDVGAMVRAGEHLTESGLARIIAAVSEAETNRSLLFDVVDAVRDSLVGYQALALASIIERADRRPRIMNLPNLPEVAETPEQKLELARAWIYDWRNAGFHTRDMPGEWSQQGEDVEIHVRIRGEAFDAFCRLLPQSVRRRFKSDWLPRLLEWFAEPMGARKHRLKGAHLALSFGGPWVRCDVCRTPQRPTRGITQCAECGVSLLIAFDPDVDSYFKSRKGFYRDPIMSALRGDGYTPIALIAAEHTAQLNAAQHEDVFSKGERNELLFQDVPLAGPTGSLLPAIDVLSSTTTMEVGIDLGQLSGVALRNMPPSRANYQQRAGRAGRRANTVASVLAYSGSDTHDEHFFSHPAEMIKGPVVDPRLSLDNREIAERHINAFLLQSYLQSKTSLEPTDQTAQLFSTLGTVSQFKLPGHELNRTDLEAFLFDNREHLRRRADQILPGELNATDRNNLLNGMVESLLAALDGALEDAGDSAPEAAWSEEEEGATEVAAEQGEERPVASPIGSKYLLDHLLYKGILPRYAFPTDVATFHVFNINESTRFRPRFEYLPAQGMTAALSQYAPGKDVWIDSKLYRSGAIYAPVKQDRFRAWAERMLHAECSRCGYSGRWRPGTEVDLGDALDCPACKGEQTLGPVHHWFRPTGFAHPYAVAPKLRPDELGTPTYATRAKLTLKSPDGDGWNPVANTRVRVLPARSTLLVSNTGAAREGFDYCTTCGLIEAHGAHDSVLRGSHVKPYPDEQEPNCPGNRVATHVILGTDFISDVALFSFRLGDWVRLPPTATITSIAMRTLSEAIARSAVESILQIEHGEIAAEFRPAVTPAGVMGEEAELFLYDTLPGGAGYSQRAVEDTKRLLEEARRLMHECKGQCDASCYQCLRTFRNRQDHGLIDRHIGVALVDYLLTGQLSPFSEKRLNAARELLLGDLSRNPGDVEYAIAHKLSDGLRATRAGRVFLVKIGHPLALPDGYDIREGDQGEEMVVSELLVQRNLAQATQIVRAWIAAI
jgi:ATP-dependent helicase YprA (DUF1998 family)